MQSNYDLSVNARGLSAKDTLSNSDPFCALFVKSGNKWTEIGRTETINDDCNPSWAKRFNLSLPPNGDQELKFEVFDYDPITGNDFLGRVETTLATLVGTGTNGLRAQLVGSGFTGKSRTGGELYIKANPGAAKGSVNQRITLQFSADNVESKDFFGKSDPYLIISSSQPDGSFTVAHRTEHCKNTKKPFWNAFTIDSHQLCQNDWNRLLKIECFDYDDDSSHEFIGSCTTTLKRLSEGPQSNTYELINQAKLGKKNYSNSGFLKLVSCHVVGPPQSSTNAAVTTGYTPATTAQSYPATAPPNASYPAAAPPPPQHQNAGYPSGPPNAGYPQNTGYPNTTGYPGSNPGYNLPFSQQQQQPGGYPGAGQPPPQGYPQPQQQYPGYPQANYPPTSGYPQAQNIGFAPNPGYPTQPGMPGFPTGYPQQGYPQPGPGYPPNPGYPPY